MPAQKPRPLPVMTRTRAVRSMRILVSASYISASSGKVSAFSFSGRFSSIQIVPSWSPVRSTVMNS